MLNFPGLFGNGLHGASGNASTTIDASAFITLSLSVYHAECADRTNVHAGAAANAGFFINFNCHGVSPWVFWTTIIFAKD